MLEQKREKFKVIEKSFGQLFSKTGLSPNQYSLISILFSFLCLYFFFIKNLVLALVFFFCAVFLDLIDGAVARATKMASRKGAYIDTICDRYVEFVALFGFLFLPLPSVIFRSEIWIFLALLGSLMTTYVKAAAKEKELVTEELRKGFFGRAERMISIFLAILLGIFNFKLMIYPIIILAIFSNFTVLQRIYLVLKPGEG